MHMAEADAADAEASLNASLTDERQSYATWTTHESGYAASDSEKLAAYAKLALPGVAPLALVSLLAAMRQSPVNTGLKSAPSLSNIRA